MGDPSRLPNSPIGGHWRALGSTVLLRRMLGRHGLHDFFVPKHNMPRICSRCGAFRCLEHVQEAADPYETLCCAACGGVWQRDVNSARGQRAIGTNAILRVPKPVVFGRRLPPRSIPAAGGSAAGRDRSAPALAPGAPSPTPGGGGVTPTHQVPA